MAPVIGLLGCPIVDLPITYVGIPSTIRRPLRSSTSARGRQNRRHAPYVEAAAHEQGQPPRVCQGRAQRNPYPSAAGASTSEEDHQGARENPEGIPLGWTRGSRNCHVNWQRVARPISLGGLGVHNLERTGLVLRTCWLWLSRTDNTRAWSGLDLQFSDDERAFFFASTTMQIGNGVQALFWDDRWIAGRSVRKIAPWLYSCIPKCRRKLRMVADGLRANRWAHDIQGTIGIQEIGEYLQLWHLIEHTTLSAEPDRLNWKWSLKGTYTAQSAYLAACLEAYLEVPGTASRPILPLACSSRSVLDC